MFFTRNAKKEIPARCMFVGLYEVSEWHCHSSVLIGL